MRILMAVPKYPFPVVGGLERQAHELGKALVQRGCTVHVLSTRFDPKQKNVEIVDGIQIHRIPWFSFKPLRFLVFPMSLVRIMVKLRTEIDLVHVHNISWFAAFIILVAKALGLPAVTKLPNFGEFGIPGVRGRRFGSWHVSILKRSDAIVAMTPESLQELRAIAYPAEQTFKVTNGIPLASSSKSNRSSTDLITAIFVGRLSSEKGLPDLLRAWALVRAETRRRIMLRLVGEGPQLEELRALVMELNLRDVVEFCGHCNDVPAVLAEADLFTLPSYAEGNSNSILEAMRAGLPVVATRVGGAAIQVGLEGERFLVAPGAPRPLADRLLELIEDEALRLRLGSAMRSRIETVFAIDRIAATYAQAYSLILAGRRTEIGQLNPTLFRSEKEEIQCAG